MLPIAMVVGLIFHSAIEEIAFVSPWLIFVMLFLTYCKLPVKSYKFDGSMLWLLIAQIGGALAVYFALKPIGESIAQGVFICVLCPTATAAPVITGMLGGNIQRVAIYSLLSNLVVALLAPVLLTYISASLQIEFFDSFIMIALKVGPLLIGPLLCAIVFRLTLPHACESISKHQGVSFYIWAIALVIVVGHSISFLLKEPASLVPQMALIAILSLIVCLAQFYVGRRIGQRYGDGIAGGQSLGQKNTILAIWLALSYLHPIASVGPACYIAWHNSVNAYQLYRKAKSGGL